MKRSKCITHFDFDSKIITGNQCQFVRWVNVRRIIICLILTYIAFNANMKWMQYYAYYNSANYCILCKLRLFSSACWCILNQRTAQNKCHYEISVLCFQKKMFLKTCVTTVWELNTLVPKTTQLNSGLGGFCSVITINSYVMWRHRT